MPFPHPRGLPPGGEDQNHGPWRSHKRRHPKNRNEVRLLEPGDSASLWLSLEFRLQAVGGSEEPSEAGTPAIARTSRPIDTACVFRVPRVSLFWPFPLVPAVFVPYKDSSVTRGGERDGR